MVKLARFARAAGPALRDMLGLGGLGLIVFGTAELTSPAAAMILSGIMCVSAAVIWAQRG